MVADGGYIKQWSSRRVAQSCRVSFVVERATKSSKYNMISKMVSINRHHPFFYHPKLRYILKKPGNI